LFYPQSLLDLFIKKLKKYVMTKYEIFKKKHKEAETVAEQKKLLKTYLLGLTAEELRQFSMDAPNVIGEILDLKGEKERQEA
jgi:hypothetical protein